MHKLLRFIFWPWGVAREVREENDRLRQGVRQTKAVAMRLLADKRKLAAEVAKRDALLRSPVIDALRRQVGREIAKAGVDRIARQIYGGEWDNDHELGTTVTLRLSPIARAMADPESMVREALRQWEEHAARNASVDVGEMRDANALTLRACVPKLSYAKAVGRHELREDLRTRG